MNLVVFLFVIVFFIVGETIHCGLCDPIVSLGQVLLTYILFVCVYIGGDFNV